MSFDKWEHLVAICQNASSNNDYQRVEILPGGVRLHSTAQSLLLTRN
jgi:hypothetical protein